MTRRVVTSVPSESVGDFGPRERTGLLRALAGKLNCVGDVALADDGVATTTDLTDEQIDANTTLVVLSPTNANAAAALATTFITYPSPGVARINHAASVLARTFRYGLFA